MNYDKQKVVDLALSQVGYHEKKSNSDLDSFASNSGDKNWTKYARDLDKLGNFYNGPKNGFAWCDVFVDWCFFTSYGRAATHKLLYQPYDSYGAGCQFSAQYFNQNGHFFKSNPQIGDQIFFGDAWTNVYHTGLVVEVGKSYVTTVEGNTSDMVAKRSYTINDNRIWGYGRPNWDPTDAGSEKKEEFDAVCSISLPKLKRGDKNGYVKSMQTLLIAQNYSCGGWGADGDFGAGTFAGLNNFQRNHGLSVDGICGEKTWAELIKF